MQFVCMYVMNILSLASFVLTKVKFISGSEFHLLSFNNFLC
jgi:hypothetical protein